MVTADVLRELLDVLREQTSFGNVPWRREVDSGIRYSYEFVGAEGTIRIVSVDDDGEFPIKVSIFDNEGSLDTEWETSEGGAADDAWIDQPTRAIWAMVVDK